MKLKDAAGIEFAIGVVMMIVGTALFVCVSEWFAILISVGLVLMIVGESREEK